MPDCLIALGANLGDRRQTLDSAIEMLRETSHVRNLRVSPYHGTQPVGGPIGQPEFLNAAARFSTSLNMEAIHARLITIEQAHGRVRLERWGSRRLDLDLLLFDERQVLTETLQVPHPRMTFRRFVLEPAVEVASEMTHPICQRTLGDLMKQLDESSPTVRIVAPPDADVDKLVRLVRQEIAVDIARYAPTADRDEPRLLVVWHLSPEEFVRLRPHGPYLPIDGADLETALLEIRAAIAAMSST